MISKTKTKKNYFFAVENRWSKYSPIVRVSFCSQYELWQGFLIIFDIVYCKLQVGKKQISQWSFLLIIDFYDSFL